MSRTSAGRTAIAFAAGALVAFGVVALHHTLTSPAGDEPDSADAPQPAATESRAVAAPEARGNGPSEQTLGQTDTSMGDAVRHPSEDFRNATLLIAIRGAGHTCNRVLSAFPGSEDGTAWRVSCSNAIAYLVADDGAGGLLVDPMPFTEAPPYVPLRLPQRGDEPVLVPRDEASRSLPADD